jgi:hypothetical protein
LLLFLVGAIDRGCVGGRRLSAWLRATIGRPASSAGTAPPHPPSHRDRRETDLLLALSFAVAVGPFFLSATPIFGGTKHWMPAYPVLALFAGRGFDIVTAAMNRALPAFTGLRRLGAEASLAACVVAPALAVTVHSHPFGLSAYVPLVGGTAGGADLGLNRQFWGYTTQNAATEYLNDRAPRGASVFLHDTTWDAWAQMQAEGRVRSDLRGVGAPSEATFALVQHELHMNEVDYDIWVTLGTDAPAYVVKHDGVPIVSVYRRP